MIHIYIPLTRGIDSPLQWLNASTRSMVMDMTVDTNPFVGSIVISFVDLYVFIWYFIAITVLLMDFWFNVQPKLLKINQTYLFCMSLKQGINVIGEMALKYWTMDQKWIKTTYLMPTVIKKFGSLEIYEKNCNLFYLIHFYFKEMSQSWSSDLILLYISLKP